jgi:hypothetical protein
MKATPLRSCLLAQRRKIYAELDNCLLHPIHHRMPNVFATSHQPGQLTALVRGYQGQRPEVSMLYVPCHQVLDADTLLLAIATANGQQPPHRWRDWVYFAAAATCQRAGARLLILDGFPAHLVKKGQARRRFFATLTSLMEQLQISFCCTGPPAALYQCWADEGALSRFMLEWRFGHTYIKPGVQFMRPSYRVLLATGGLKPLALW